MAKFVCSICGYVYEGEALPADFKCPLCGAGADKFSKLEEGAGYAAEHAYGVYDSIVKNNDKVPAEDKQYILEQLKSMFAGECSEVGMYLCMSRIATREGYPEIGATQGRVDLAKCAKKYDLDPIHDAVHEIGRDEARHGRAFKGLLDRYFK